MMLHWLARGLGVQMAPMLRVNRAMHEQMKPRRGSKSSGAVINKKSEAVHV